MLIATSSLVIGNDEGAFTQAGHLKGWNEMQRSIPYISAYYDAISKFQHSKSWEPWFVDTFANKWR